MKKKQTLEMKAGRMARKAAKVLEDRGLHKGGPIGRSIEGKPKGLCVRSAFAMAYCGNLEVWNAISTESAIKDGWFPKGIVKPHPVGDACLVFAKWLNPECNTEAYAHVWNDATAGTDDDGLRFPAPSSTEEVVAILNKFADEMDPQR